MRLVKFDYSDLPVEWYDKYPFKPDDRFILTEFPIDDEHCNVLDLQTQRMYSGYHTENFIDLTRDEVFNLEEYDTFKKNRIFN